ncbi:hypothetical protein BJX62DRAFT_238161 [Aspergillus germanicus]
MIPKLSFLLLTLTTILPATHAQSSEQQTPCYWPNGSPAENYLPCPDSRVCCLTNGLCYGSRYNLAYRGACTDRAWPENECPHVCYTEVSSSFADIRPCPGNPRGFATCGPSGWVTEICEWNLLTFWWPPARVLVAQLVNVSSTSETETTGTGTATETVTVIASASANPASNAEAGTDTAGGASGGSGNCSDTERRFGAGLGLGLGIPLLAVSIALVMSRVRGRRAERRSAVGVINAAGVFGSENKTPSGQGSPRSGIVGELHSRGLPPELSQRDTHELQ